MPYVVCRPCVVHGMCVVVLNGACRTCVANAAWTSALDVIHELVIYSVRFMSSCNNTRRCPLLPASPYHPLRLRNRYSQARLYALTRVHMSTRVRAVRSSVSWCLIATHTINYVSYSTRSAVTASLLAYFRLWSAQCQGRSLPSVVYVQHNVLCSYNIQERSLFR